MIALMTNTPWQGSVGFCQFLQGRDDEEQLDLSMIKEPTVEKKPATEIETAEQFLKTQWWDEARTHLDPETIVKMKPNSDEEHFIGNEYFVG